MPLIDAPESESRTVGLEANFLQPTLRQSYAKSFQMSKSPNGLRSATATLFSHLRLLLQDSFSRGVWRAAQLHEWRKDQVRLQTHPYVTVPSRLEIVKSALEHVWPGVSCVFVCRLCG